MGKIHALPVTAQSTLFLLLLPFQLSAQADKIKESNMPFESRQHITGSLEERNLVSGEINSPFTLFVYLPPTYGKSPECHTCCVFNSSQICL